MHFEKFRSKKNNQWYWRLRAGNGQIIATGGEGYASERSCDNGIASVKTADANTPVETVESN